MTALRKNTCAFLIGFSSTSIPLGFINHRYVSAILGISALCIAIILILDYHWSKPTYIERPPAKSPEDV